MKRFDMWKQSRVMISENRARQKAERNEMLEKVSIDIRKKLMAMYGETDEKKTLAVTDRYTYNLRGDPIVPRRQ